MASITEKTFGLRQKCQAQCKGTQSRRTNANLCIELSPLPISSAKIHYLGKMREKLWLHTTGSFAR